MGHEKGRWRVAAVQMNSSEDRAKNLSMAEYLARRAVDAGARLVAFPEHFSCFQTEGCPVRGAERLDGELGGWLRNLATELGCYLLAGSICEKAPRTRRVYNTSLLIDPTGTLLATYRKMHLFDLRLRGRLVLSESRTVSAGSEPVIVRTPLGKLGLSICYDLRFPELFRHLVLGGAQVIFVPSAFTSETGRHHWIPLLRARAIENQCWVVAPAQVGWHNSRRESHGHTAVVDPWGNVVAMLDEDVGLVTAEIDLGQLARVRTEMPCLRHVHPELLGVEAKPARTS